MSQTPLSPNSNISFGRHFHVEMLRGGMNRLLLRSMPTKTNATRVEFYFPYVQHLDIPMQFDELTIYNEAADAKLRPSVHALMRKFPECRLFRLESKGDTVGHIVAAHCIYGEDTAPIGSESMFPIEP